MSKVTDAILAKGQAYGAHSANLNLAHGGQNGNMAAIGQIGADGRNYDEWISNQAYVRRNIIPVVLKYPKFLDFMPQSTKWIEAYKALIELHPLSINGLASGLTVEFDEHAIGGAGEMQEEITNVTRARSSLSFTFKEKAGKSIQKFLDMVIRYGYLDPDVDKPLVTNLMTAEQLAAMGGVYTADYFTGTVIFIEPDVTHNHVVDAWLCVNMMFKSNGERIGKRDIHTAGEAPELSIDSTAITMNNDSVLNLADTILASLSVLNSDPDKHQPLPQSEINAVIKSKDVGFNSTGSTAWE